MLVCGGFCSWEELGEVFKEGFHSILFIRENFFDCLVCRFPRCSDNRGSVCRTEREGWGN